MSEVLAIPDSANAIQQAYQPEDVLAVSKSGDYLPRLTLVGSNSDVFKTGKVTQIGVYALIWDENRFKVLGSEVPFLSMAVRPTAMDLSAGNPIIYHNRKSSEFIRIQNASKIQGSQCIFGPEFLVWIPDAGEFATFFMGSWSARKESPNLLSLMEKPDKSFGPAKALLAKPAIGENAKKQKYHVPVIQQYSPDLPASADPDWESKYVTELQKFLTAPDATVEKVATADSGRAR